MNLTKGLLNLLILALLAACGKDDVADKSNVFECVLDGEKYEVEGLFAYATKFETDNTVGIYGLQDESGENSIIVSIPDEGETKNYTMDGNTEGAYGIVNLKGTVYLTSLEDGAGEVELTKVSETQIEGTFSFTAYDGSGNKVEVKAGEFKVEIR